MFDNRTHVVASRVEKALRDDLCAWCKDRRDEWDRFVRLSESKGTPGSIGLWDRMPAIDSKAVTETSPIFERHLGVKLDPNLIRPGGYASDEELVADLIPKMIALADRGSKESK